MKPILSVVFQKAHQLFAPWNPNTGWVETGLNPVNEYIGSGGHMTPDLQKAQVFGFSKKAKERLKSYSDTRLYEVRPVIIKEV